MAASTPSIITANHIVTVEGVEEPAPITYTVSFNANSGTVTPTSSITGTDGKIASLPTPTRNGNYSFKGWYTAESGGTKVETDHIFTADTTIYAQWKNNRSFRVRNRSI